MTKSTDPQISLSCAERAKKKEPLPMNHVYRGLTSKQFHHSSTRESSLMSLMSSLYSRWQCSNPTKSVRKKSTKPKPCRPARRRGGEAQVYQTCVALFFSAKRYDPDSPDAKITRTPCACCAEGWKFALEAMACRQEIVCKWKVFYVF